MDIFDFLTMLGGLSLFLFGMSVMGQGLERAAGSKLKTILERLTSSPVKGFFLGVVVTAVIQSSSATTITVVAEEDWMTAVMPAPTRMPRKRLEVSRSRMPFMRLPAAASRPALIICMP